MKKMLMTVVMAVSICALSMAQSIPAFPTAEGYGMWATGGRGGQVVEVTTLEDDANGTIEGSLRWALKQYSSQPVTIVFRVSGVIELVADLRSSRTAGTTIAGQTAPGDGICIRGAKCNFGGSKNLIIRHIRFRIGLKENEDGTTTFISGGSIGIENAENWIIDHCTFGWSGEENMTIYDNKLTTVQWCIVHEGLYDCGHSKGNRGYGTQWGGQTATYHHNLIAHCYNRAPRFNGARSNDTKVLLDYVNNVCYNWGKENSAYGGDMVEGSVHHANVVNNYYKPGPARPGTSKSYFVSASFNGNQKTTQIPLWYLSGNYMEGTANKTNNTDNLNGLKADEYISKGIAKSKIVSSDHFDVPYPVTTETAAEAYVSVLSAAGAFPRDTVDSRIINEVRTGTAACKGSVAGVANGIIDTPADAGGYPDYYTYDVKADNDHDGMADAWETKNGLDPTNAEDRNLILKSGYTALEAYLSTLTGENIPVELPQVYDIVVAADGSGDYTTITDAIEAVSEGSDRTLILVKKGTYNEKVYIGSHSQSVNKVLSLIGEDRDSVVIVYDDYNGKQIYYDNSENETKCGTPQSATMTINAPDFYMENMTIVNSYTSAQAVALYNVGDRQTFKNCRIVGFQDTHYLKKGRRSFFYQCIIEGGTDFICAGGTAYFYQCTIKSLNGGAFITAPEDITYTAKLSTGKTLYYGFIFNDCDIVPGSGVGTAAVYLGRPWQATSGSIFMNCRLGNHIKTAGWSTWSNDNHLTSSFAEYKNMNADGTELADVSQRVSWSIQLTDSDYYDFMGLRKIYKSVSSTIYDPLAQIVAPVAPKTLSVSSKKLTWTTVPDAIGYLVYANNSLIAYANANAYKDLTTTGTVTYKVRAVGANGCLSLFNGNTTIIDSLLTDSILNPIAPVVVDTIPTDTIPSDTLAISQPVVGYSVADGLVSFSDGCDYELYNITGNLLAVGKNEKYCSLHLYQRGVYLLRFRNEKTVSRCVKVVW